MESERAAGTNETSLEARPFLEKGMRKHAGNQHIGSAAIPRFWLGAEKEI
ncbi:MAG: hypothetical protein ACYC46_02000 [Acidobacteriaceae bacterium]